MKKLLLSMIVLALILFVSCKESAGTEAEAETTETAETEMAGPDYADFDAKVSTIRAFFTAHENEDLEAQASMLADTITWSPPVFNDYAFLGKDELLATLKNYHDTYDDIKYTEGVVTQDSVVGGFYSGSHYPQATATNVADVLRIYGTWTAKHSESGEEIGVKFFSLASFDADGKIATYSSYFDTSNLARSEE